MLRLRLLGVGAMKSPRFAPAGLLVEHDKHRVMLDGGPGSAPQGELEAWLVTDERCELMSRIRQLAKGRDLQPAVATYRTQGLELRPLPVVHTSHPAFGYLIKAAGKKIVWAPEFFRFPRWAAGADLMFAEGAGWNRPIHFAGNVGGHACVLDVARDARRSGVRRLVFAHIGRPTVRAIDAGFRAPFGELGDDGRTYVVRGRTDP